MAIEGTLPAVFRHLPPVTFIAANGIAAKVLAEPTPAAPGNTPALYGGSTLIDITASSSDTVNRDLQLYVANQTTTVGTATGMASVTLQTVVRANGDFIADGWRVGDLLMLFAPAGAAAQASEGVLGIVTAAASSTLTVNGTPFTAVGSLTAGTRICRVKPHLRVTLPANAGSDGITPTVGLLNHGKDGAAVRSELKLDAASLLVAALPVAISALPAFASLSAVVALY
ncbi:hypothetical protein IGB42_01925 [Andreprevotia sp. IGB-42]|uniref:hypothetical protein n=1 Tax=Andreprevotia sp. IGB-42 TaxID=2497473 RepID=UPI0013594663|nr:hypothetical protein [Andreprevotia sp. IGB-42]KAF0813574.1 hypothetical protein IGB42_01925 [Andreprevotia sp. IGB-42]